MATFEQPTNMDPNNNIVRNWLTGVGVALVVIVGITFALHSKETLSPVVAGDESSTTASTASTTMNRSSTAGSSSSAFATLSGTVTTPSLGETVSVADQPAGKSVAINAMSLMHKSWIAIKDTDGRILGAGLFPATATEGVVPLLRATTAGDRYEVLIYVDNGDKVFSLHKDMLVVSADGSPIGAAFNTK
jgi:hypothetical protein